MVQVSYPGVYIQEVPSGVHTITSVATSITAFIDWFKEAEQQSDRNFRHDRFRARVRRSR